jgi:hypothetical protein
MTFHAPSDYKTTIVMDFQQLMEVRKAVTDRILKLFFADENEYEHREQDIETLNDFMETIEKHIATATNEWETKIVEAEKIELDDSEAWQKFLDG